MTLQTITVEVSPRRVATLTLNRPDRGNSFNQALLDELRDQLLALQADDRVRVVVLRGSGKHFCTGADLASRGDGAAAAAEPAKPPATLRDVLIAVDTLSKPTIAVVHGGALGGGAAVVACCDVALATDAAFFSIPEVRVGMAPHGVTPFLIRAMGYRNFRRYGFSGSVLQPPKPCASASCMSYATRQPSTILSPPSSMRCCLGRPARSPNSRALPHSSHRRHSPPSSRMARRTIQDRRRLSRGSQASARSANRTGIRNEHEAEHARSMPRRVAGLGAGLRGFLQR